MTAADNSGLVSKIKYADHVWCAHYKSNAIHPNVWSMSSKTVFGFFYGSSYKFVEHHKCSLPKGCELTLNKTV